MSGYVTQSRPTPRALRPWRYISSSDLSGSDWNYWPSSQVTTSYRSGRTDNVIGDGDPLSFNPSSYKEAFATYKDAYEADGGLQGIRSRSAPKLTDKNGKDFVDTGHTFDTRIQTAVFSHPSYTIDGRQINGLYYKGPLVPEVATGSDPWAGASFPDTSWYQARAIAITAPNNPMSNLATTLGELKFDQPPHVVGASMRHQANFFKSLGEEYLNVEFGWKPFINDVKSIISSVIHARKIVAQYERDSGRMVRRRHTFPDVRSVIRDDSRVSGWLTPPPSGPSFYFHNNLTSNAGYDGKSSVTETTLSSKFSGGYSYYLHRGQSYVDKLKRFEQLGNHLLGTRLTPETLWELAPWSWLADWHSNIGDNITNAVNLSSDGLVIRYGYLMTTLKVVRTDTYRRYYSNTVGWINGPITATYTTVHKVRERATPYGFGSDPASFTNRQWAILAALGMTKTPTSLR